MKLEYISNYAIQCRDAGTGVIGCFLFDVDHHETTGEFLAVSPVFPSLIEFYAWDNANGTKRKASYRERTQ